MENEGNSEGVTVNELAYKEHIKYFQRFLHCSPTYISYQDSSR